MTIPSRMYAAVSVESIAFSSRSKMSFQRITTIGSIPDSNSEAISPRTMRSASFSSRLTSTVCLLMSLYSRTRLIAAAISLVETEVVGHFLGVVNDVIDRRGEPQDVLAIDRRDEALVDPADRLVREL